MRRLLTELSGLAWSLLIAACLAGLLGGCGPTENLDDGDPGEPCHPRWYHCQAAADACLNTKLDHLDNIDHETPSAGAVFELAAFCERQYPAPGAERFRPGYIVEPPEPE